MNALRNLSPRQIFLAIFVGCAGLLAFGLYLQYVEGLEPCPLCALQRYAFVCIGLIALLATIVNPEGLVLQIWSVLLALVAIAGGGVSIRQSWLQHNPPEVSTCGPGLEYMVSKLPLTDVLPQLFRGEGDCAKVDWTFLGLSIAECALIAFTAIAAVSIWQAVRKTSR